MWINSHICSPCQIGICIAMYIFTYLYKASTYMRIQMCKSGRIWKHYLIFWGNGSKLSTLQMSENLYSIIIASIYQPVCKDFILTFPQNPGTPSSSVRFENQICGSLLSCELCTLKLSLGSGFPGQSELLVGKELGSSTHTLIVVHIKLLLLLIYWF